MKCTNIVKIDIDKPYDCKDIVDMIINIYNEVANNKVIRYEVYKSQSGNIHVVAHPEKPVCSCIQLYIIQMLLGNDPIRSLLNLQRCLSLGKPLDILFARKEKRNRGEEVGKDKAQDD